MSFVGCHFVVSRNQNIQHILQGFGNTGSCQPPLNLQSFFEMSKIIKSRGHLLVRCHMPQSWDVGPIAKPKEDVVSVEFLAIVFNFIWLKPNSPKSCWRSQRMQRVMRRNIEMIVAASHKSEWLEHVVNHWIIQIFNFEVLKVLKQQSSAESILKSN